MKPTIHISLLLSLGTLPSAALADPIYYQPSEPLKRIYSLYKAAETDQLLTDNVRESTGWGGTSTGEVWYLEREAQATTRPLYRLYKGSPQREHFYTSDAAERDLARSLGYVVEGPAIGHIYVTSLPGTTGLHRLTRYDPATGDLVHRYTIDDQVVQSLEADGFEYEGVAGHVYRTATPTNPTGWVFGSRCATQGHTCNTASPTHRNGYFNNLAVPSEAALPAGSANTLTLSFELWTPDFFGSGDHFVITPRARNPFVHPDITQSRLQGLALAIGAASYLCGPTSDAFIEQFWPEHNPPIEWNGYNYDAVSAAQNHTANTCGGINFHNGERYQLTVAIRTDGLARYTVRRYGALLAQRQVYYRRDVSANVPAFDPGGLVTWLIDASTSNTNHTVYLNNMRYTWTTELLATDNCSGRLCDTP